MKIRTASLLLAALVAAVPLTTYAQTRVPPDQNRLGAMAWLAGDWHSTLEVQSGTRESLRVESHFRSELDGKMMTMIMSEGGHALINGMFAYDGGKKSVVFWYVTVDPENASSEDSGTLATGLVKIEQNSLLLDFLATRPDGATGHYQTRIEHMDASHYRWVVYADYPGEGIERVNEMIFERGL